MKVTLTIEKEFEVKYLLAEAGVRYWEDATINGTEDEEGNLVPCREGNIWKPTIELETGKILNWPEGTTADIHYKVCDAGTYHLLDEEKNIVTSIKGYVPDIMCPEGDGYGDYIIMNVDGNGMIDKWEVVLDEFKEV